MTARTASSFFAVMFVLSTGCAEDTPEPSDGPPLRILTVDEEGAPVLARRVVWQPQPADPFWIEATPATCESGEPPCSAWVVEDAITERIAVTAERATEATATETCQPYASAFAVVHPGTAAVPRQTLHLTLPTFGTYCIDEGTARALINVPHDEDLDASDVLAGPEEVTSAITVSLVDQDGAPVPGTIAHWYYPPESPEHDGEHPLRCVDQRCETWVVESDAYPRPGPIYLTANYAGPLNPFSRQGWTSYGAGPFMVELDASGAVAPLAVQLTLPTDEEAAAGD